MAKKKKSKRGKYKLLNIVLAIIGFSIFTGLLIFGAIFDFLDQWNINPYIASIVLLIGAIISLIYLVWALFNFRLLKIFRG